MSGSGKRIHLKDMVLYEDTNVKFSVLRTALMRGCVVCGIEPLHSERDNTVWAKHGTKWVYVCGTCDQFPIESQKVLDELTLKGSSKRKQ